ncbi:stimulated by retinoic acid gene 6 protein-like isoform X4 [Tamandua tetradactyla]
MPLDFVGTFSNRWSYGIAFGATANKVMFLFSEGYQPLQVPQWAQAFVLLIGGFEVGLSHFPFFACLSSEFRLVSAILGFSYSLIWFAVTILHVAKCPHGQFLGRFQSVVFYWPSLLCLAFLLGRFLHMFAKSLRDHPGWELQAEPKPFLEVHQAEHVLRLLRRCPLSEKKKSWFQTRIYEWDPCFQFPSRMIGTTVLAFICLYLFMVIEFCVFIYVRDELAVFEGKLESYVTSTNKTGALTPVILQVKELISVSKEVWVVTILPAALTCVTYLFHILACYRCLKTCPVFKGCRIGDKSHQAPSRGISLKDTARTEGHRSSNLKNSSMSRGDGPTYLGSAYIMHMKRLWSGDRQFLPVKFRSPSPSESVAAIARYSGWQIAYVLWGYLIIHVLQSLCGLGLMYSLVLPVAHGQGLEVLRGLGIGTLTVTVVVGLMVLQVRVAATFFLQPKMSPADKQKPLALHHRSAFHNFSYFLFFYNALLGLGACLSRLLLSCILGTWLIARIDRTILQRGYERADMGFRAWAGMLFVDHYHTNPALVSFCHILMTGHRERKLQKAVKCQFLNQSPGPRVSARSRTRWLLLQTLMNNPTLVTLRKSKEGHGTRQFPQMLLTSSES